MEKLAILDHESFSPKLEICPGHKDKSMDEVKKTKAKKMKLFDCFR